MSGELSLQINLEQPGSQEIGGFAELDVPTATERVAERLVTAIALGEYVAGQRLPPERELAVMLGIGRNTIRAAFHRLAALGYLRIQRGRGGGAFVTTDWQPGSSVMIRRTLVDNWPAFVDLLDLRQLIDPLVAATAADRHDESDARRLREAGTAYRTAPDREASRAADQLIHVSVADAAHNAYLSSLSLQIRSKVTLGFLAEPYSPEIRKRAVETHDDLIAAILARDGVRAAEAMAHNIALTDNAIRSLVAELRDSSSDNTDKPIEGST